MLTFIRSIFAPSAIKTIAAHVESEPRKLESEIEFHGLSWPQILKEVKRDTLRLIYSSEARQQVTDDPPNLHYQALHSMGQVIYSYFAIESLVKVGPDTFCSASLRNPFGQLTDEGRNLKVFYHVLMKRIVELGFEDEESEYVKQNLSVINDAASPSFRLQ